jgi:hypothetical protein
MNGVWVYDVETLSNCFTYTAMERDTKEVVQFTIWEDINELDELLAHLNSVKGLIGFNNLSFDYPVLHFILNSQEKWIYGYPTGGEIASEIYNKAQEIIEDEWSGIRDKYIKIPQLDLFRIWHYNNKARMTSLKKLQIAFRYHNVQDMPYKHYDKIETREQVQEILDYNLNDVDSTLQFYIKTIPKIELRKGLYDRYGLKCMNYPDSKIGEELTLKLYCDETGENYTEVKKRRTYRDNFKFSECVPEYVDFETTEFNNLLDYLNGIEVEEIKGSFKYSFEYQGFTFDLGTGGIHGCIKSGVYKETDTHMIVDVDVASLYPSLAIVGGLYPEHLGEIFLTVYEDGLLKPRLEAKKNGDKVMNTGFKLSLNSVYGKSNSEYSWLYDPLYTLKTTLAGQLALVMLSEMLMTNVDDMTMLQINTDGLTAIIPRTEKRNFYNQCVAWEKKTNLTLEYQAYKQMIIRDVNSYIAQSLNGYVKYKGAFVTYEEMIKNDEYHKSLSQMIVPEAIAKYFLEGKPVEQTIMECDNIYEFCKTFNATHGWTCETITKDKKEISFEDVTSELKELGYIEISENFFKPPNSGNMAGVYIEPEGQHFTNTYSNRTQRQKTNRYFVSTNGEVFRKMKDDRVIEIEAGGTLVSIFNKFEEKDSILDYNIDYDYYIKECYKIIHKIDGTEERVLKEKKEAKELAKREAQEEKFLKYCINKQPTVRQLGLYGKDWLIEKYGEVTPR